MTHQITSDRELASLEQILQHLWFDFWLNTEIYFITKIFNNDQWKERTRTLLQNCPRAFWNSPASLRDRHLSICSNRHLYICSKYQQVFLKSIKIIFTSNKYGVFYTDFFSTVSIVNFEQVNAGWVFESVVSLWVSLTHFCPKFHSNIPWKHQKSLGFLMLSVDLEMGCWDKM